GIAHFDDFLSDDERYGPLMKYLSIGTRGSPEDHPLRQLRIRPQDSLADSIDSRARLDVGLHQLLGVRGHSDHFVWAGRFCLVVGLAVKETAPGRQSRRHHESLHAHRPPPTESISSGAAYNLRRLACPADSHQI